MIFMKLKHEKNRKLCSKHCGGKLNNTNFRLINLKPFLMKEQALRWTLNSSIVEVGLGNVHQQRSLNFFIFLRPFRIEESFSKLPSHPGDLIWVLCNFENKLFKALSERYKIPKYLNSFRKTFIEKIVFQLRPVCYINNGHDKGFNLLTAESFSCKKIRWNFL